MTFQEYLKSTRVFEVYGDSPELDFANDSQRDKTFREFKSFSDLETYLVFRGACRDAVKAAKKVYRQWRSEHGGY